MGLSAPVQLALKELREQIKDLSHPDDRQHALSMFVYLIKGGEHPHYDEVRAWSLEEGFEEDDARDLANMPDDIRYLIGRLASGVGWGRPDAWFAEA